MVKKRCGGVKKEVRSPKEIFVQTLKPRFLWLNQTEIGGVR